MRNIENSQTLQSFGMFVRQHPYHHRAPVMAHQIDFFVVQRIYQPDNIVHKFSHTIALNSFWLIAQVVSALIGDNDTKSGCGKRWDLIDPAAPGFRKTMQQNDRNSALWTGKNGM